MEHGKISFFVLVLVLLGLCFVSTVVHSETYCQATMPSPTDQQNPPGVLELVVATIRHGDRTPAVADPPGYTDGVMWNCSLNSLSIFDDTESSSSSPGVLFRKIYLPGREILPGNCSLGQLTEKGSGMHLMLGQILRERYVENFGLLPQNLSLGDIWVRGTDVPRVQQSAQSLLYGLYPPETRLTEDGSSSVPAIVTRTIDLTLDNMFANPNLCPRLNELYEEVESTPAFIDFLSYALPLNNYLTEIFQTNVSFLDICDTIRARTCHDFPLLKGINESLAYEIENATTTVNLFLLNTTELLRLGIGSFLLEELAQIDNYINGESQSKFVLFSGHDSTIWPLKIAFGYEQDIWPPYASNLLIELWNDASVYSVQIILDGEIMIVPGCSEVGPCPYDTFKSALEPFLPVDYEQECQLQGPSNEELLRLDPGVVVRRLLRRSPSRD